MAASPHFTVHELLQTLEHGGSTRRIASRVLAHLRALCPECDRIYREFEAVRDRRRDRRDYSEAFRSAQATATTLAHHLAEESDEARRQFRQLVDTQPEERIPAVENARSRYRSPVLVSLLVEDAKNVLRIDPSEALNLLNVAEAIGERLSRPDYGEAFIERLLVWVEAHRANALRVLGELQGAELVWQSVHRRRQRCPLIDAGEAGELASLEASLRQDQRRFEEAVKLLQIGERCFRDAGNRTGIGKVLIKQGNVLYLRGEFGAAITNWQQAAGFLDDPACERLFLMTQHNQALALLDLGEIAAAEHLLDEQEDRLQGMGDPWARALRSWIEGRLARARGRSADAAEALHAARNAYLGLHLGLDAALVTLELAELYLIRGDWREVKRLARLMESIFAAQDVHAEALRALRLFEEAALAETLTAELVERIRRYLELARNDRRFRFDPNKPVEGTTGLPATPPLRARSELRAVVPSSNRCDTAGAQNKPLRPFG